MNAFISNASSATMASHAQNQITINEFDVDNSTYAIFANGSLTSEPSLILSEIPSRRFLKIQFLENIPRRSDSYRKIRSLLYRFLTYKYLVEKMSQNFGRWQMPLQMIFSFLNFFQPNSSVSSY